MTTQGISYAVDLVLCIDETGSMRPIIDRVKKSALSFSDDVRAVLAVKGKDISSLRVRVIGFRDYYYDAERSLEASDFFELPKDNDKFKSFVSGMRPEGGGDEPETGLEALATAINSPWANPGTGRHRQLIVVWTDASAHPLEKNAGTKPSAYPAGMPKDLDELTDWWEGQSAHVNQSARRLILFAPDGAGWNEIGSSWDQTVHLASQAGAGLSDVEFSTILDSIANSI